MMTDNFDDGPFVPSSHRHRHHLIRDHLVARRLLNPKNYKPHTLATSRIIP
jgi:hypothetical protein